MCTCPRGLSPGQVLGGGASCVWVGGSDPEAPCRGSVGLASCWEGSVRTHLGFTDLPAGGPHGRPPSRAARPRGQQQGPALACSVLRASIRTRETSEGPALRPPGQAPSPPVSLAPRTVGVALCCGSCSPCPPSPGMPWSLVLWGRQACRLRRAAGALPRRCVPDCRGPWGGVRLDRLQGAPGCRPLSARPQALGRCPWSCEGG